MASLKNDRPRSIVPAAIAEPGPFKVPEIRSAAEALTLLQKLEHRLLRASNAPGEVDGLRLQTEAAGRFFRKTQSGRQRSAAYQWHQVSRMRPKTGATHLILRPLHAVPFVSVLEFAASGGPLRADVIRAYGASGIVLEFHPGQRAERGDAGSASRYFLEREISLTAVEIFCAPVNVPDLEVSLRGGIAIEPSVGDAGLHALQLAQAEIHRRRFDRAAGHIRTSIGYLKHLR